MINKEFRSKLYTLITAVRYSKKIQHVFGTEVPIKLDLFHAISRVTQKISKQQRHFLSGSCILDFVNVFRCDNDKEKERKQQTPSSQEIMDSLKRFLLKWKDMKNGEDENVLTLLRYMKLTA